MEPKKIICPQCHGVLEVTNPKNQPSLLITCPNPECGAKMRVTFDTGETQLADDKPTKSTIGSLRMGREIHPLRLGCNTVGRKSPDSDATIQFTTDDRTMSRQHLEVEVVQLKNGRIKVIASDARTEEQSRRKPVLYEDEPLANTDRIVLVNGDVLTLGGTKIKYVVA